MSCNDIFTIIQIVLSLDFMKMFILQLIASFLVGGFFITLITWVAQRFGGKLGGFIAGIPSTIAVSLFFIGVASGPKAAALAATAVPITVNLFGLYLVAFVLASRKSFWHGFGIAAIVWLCGAIGIVVLSSFPITWGYILGTVLGTLILYKIIDLQKDIIEVSGKRISLSKTDLLFRGILSGTLIVMVIVASKIAGPFIGGVVAILPIANATTYIILYKKEGVELLRNMSKHTIVSASLSMIAYSLVVYFSFEAFGIWWGTLLAYGAVCIVSIPAYIFLQRVK